MFARIFHFELFRYLLTPYSSAEPIQLKSSLTYIRGNRYIEGMNNLKRLVVGCLRINVDLAIFQPYLDLKAGDNQSLKIKVARLGIEPWSSCSASQELIHSANAASNNLNKKWRWYYNSSTQYTVVYISTH